MKRAKISKETEQWVIDNYPFMRNKEIIRKTGLTENVIRRIREEHGLQKDIGFYHKTRADVTRVAVEKYMAKNEERKAKIKQTKNETIRKEKRRMMFGLPQKTRQRLLLDPNLGKKKRCARYRAKMHGYIIIPTDKTTIYYSDNTNRTERFERYSKQHFNFKFKEYDQQSTTL